MKGRKSVKALAALVSAGLASGMTGAMAQELKNGGSMVVTYANDLRSLDPAIGYDPRSWNTIKALYKGVMGFEPAATTLRPDLAESYTISPDGLTYTFKMRPGIKFTNGRAITAEDVRYSINRVVNPKTLSPGQSFFHSIAGFDDFVGGKADNLTGIRAIDDKTVEIKLSKPDASFLMIMAINFSFPVPKEEVEKSGSDFGKKPVGDGPFKLQEWVQGQRIVLVRNPDYYEAGSPHLDKVTIEVGQDSLTSLLRFQKGEVDLLGDGIPAAKFTEFMNDPKYKANVIVSPRLRTSYLSMKTNAKPFDDVRVRQAVSYAINKKRVRQLVNGRSEIANQVLPPGMGGHDDAYQGYDYDPQKAKALLAEAGYPDGFSTELFASNTDPDPRIAQALQQDLAAIGIKANLQVLAGASVSAAGGDPAQGPMVWSGTLGWGADYPDASNFYTPIFSCSSATKGGWNWAFYCNKKVEAEANAANSVVDPAKLADHDKLWAQTFKDLMADAPVVPILFDNRYTVKASRLQAPEGVFKDQGWPLINYALVYAADGK